MALFLFTSDCTYLYERPVFARTNSLSRKSKREVKPLCREPSSACKDKMPQLASGQFLIALLPTDLNNSSSNFTNKTSAGGLWMRKVKRRIKGTRAALLPDLAFRLLASSLPCRKLEVYYDRLW